MHLNSQLNAEDNNKLSKRCDLILAWIRMHGPATDRQICEGLNMPDMNNVRPRCTELLDGGYLQEVGMRRDHVTGKPVRILAIRG